MLKRFLTATALALLSLPVQAATMRVDIIGGMLGNPGTLGMPEPDASGYIPMSWSFTYDSADAVVEMNGSEAQTVIRAGSNNGKPGFQNSVLTIGNQTFTNFGSFESFADFGPLPGPFPGVNNLGYYGRVNGTQAGHALDISFSLLVIQNGIGAGSFPTGLDAEYALMGGGVSGPFSLPLFYGSLSVNDAVIGSDGTPTPVASYGLNFEGGQVTVTEVSAVPLPATLPLLAGALLLPLLRRRR